MRRWKPWSHWSRTASERSDLDPPRDFAGRGTARSAVDGFFGLGKNPSTRLCLVNLPRKGEGGFCCFGPDLPQ